METGSQTREKPFQNGGNRQGPEEFLSVEGTLWRWRKALAPNDSLTSNKFQATKILQCSVSQTVFHKTDVLQTIVSQH